ncbi:MAG: ABC transporter substrate-binding protein [Deltaproteobacteria bacterium]|nr:ABC transporter substrate-binding protein [Deltaproteobacteria bacterium]
MARLIRRYCVRGWITACAGMTDCGIGAQRNRSTLRDRLVANVVRLTLLCALICASNISAQQLETLNVSYASVTGSRIPLWIAKDVGLFEKYGLNVNLVIIAAGNAAIGALANGDVEILGAPGSTTMVSAAKGLPFAIVGTFGPSAWKLATHPSITTVEQLRGKTVGISRPGTTIDFATRRALQTLGFTPGKDVNILATGLAESNKRIMVMLQGKMDATLVSPDNLYEAEIKGWKLSIVADLKELGIVTSASDLSAKRDFLKNQRQKARAFMMAYVEGIWYGKANKNAALASFRKHMRESDPRRVEALHKNYVVDYLPARPFPMEEAIQADIENLTPTVPEFRGKKVADFVDKSILTDLEREGFFTQLANRYGKQL